MKDTNKKDIRELWKLSPEYEETLEKSFDGWVLTFGIKDSVGGKPDWFSLAYQMRYALNDFIEKQVEKGIELAMPRDTSGEREEDIAWEISEKITSILGYRGIYDQGKNFLDDVNQRIMPIIEKELASQKELWLGRARVEERVRAFEIIHKAILSSKNLVAINFMERIQREIMDDSALSSLSEVE